MPPDKTDLDEQRPGFFRSFCGSVIRSLSADQLTSFCGLGTDEQRIDFVYGLPVERQVVLSEVFKAKDETEAKRKKDEGNRLFAKRHYAAAMQCYSQAIAKAPFKEGTSELMAVCAANRSACLLQADEHERCLADIELALLSGYPPALRYKVLVRRTRSLMALKRFTEAKTACQSVITALDDSNLGHGQQLHWQKEVQQMLALCDHTKCKDAPVQTQAWRPPVPPVVAGVNQHYPSASKKVAVRSTPEEGRFAVSVQPVTVGDVLVVEKPFAAVLLPEKYSTHCLHCHIRIRDCVPCTGCSGVLFCSLACRAEALGTYHRFECRIQDLLHNTGVDYGYMLALRLISRLTAEQLLEARPRLNQPLTGPYQPDDYANIHRLVSHAERLTPKVLFGDALLAVFMLRCLEFQRYFGDDVNTERLDDTRRYVGGLLLHHIDQVRYNTHEVAELRMKAHNDIHHSRLQDVGSAIYPTLALFNHSCDPGIVRYVSGNTVIARAIKNMEKGDIIYENYGPLYFNKPRSERLQVLRERYKFECKCKPCTELWPTFEDMDNGVLRFKCQTCKRPIEKSKEAMSRGDEMTERLTCNCNLVTTMVNLETNNMFLRDAYAAFETGTRYLKAGELSRGMQTLMTALTNFSQCLYPTSREYHICQENIRTVMFTLGNKFVAENKQ